MKRFRRFIGKELDIEKASDASFLDGWKVKVRYAPEEPEEFDEFEFATDFKGQGDVGFLVAIENGKIARVLFGWTVKDDPDMLKPMSDTDLQGLLQSRGEDLVQFFSAVTR